LSAAVEVAHARGIKVTNGGLVSDLVAALVADSFEERGEANRAENYLNKTMKERNWKKLKRTKKWQEQVERGQSFLAGYKNTAGQCPADYKIGLIFLAFTGSGPFGREGGFLPPFFVILRQGFVNQIIHHHFFRGQADNLRPADNQLVAENF